MTATLHAPAAAVVDVDPVNDRDGWLDWRQGGIGASDIAGVLGISRWSSPWRVWAEKLNLIESPDPSDVMKAGTYFEDGIRRWFMDETGLEVVGVQAALESLAVPLARCTVDGSIPGPTAAGLEIKNEGPGRAWEQIPDQYQAQGQWQMFVAGWDEVHFAVLHGRRPDFGHVLQRDEADIALMIERAEEFWAEHIVTGTPPPVDGSDATERVLKELYPLGDPRIERADLAELADTIAEWRQAKQDQADAERRGKAAANEIRAALGDATEGEIGGVTVVTYRQQSRKETVQAASTFRVLRHVNSKEK